MFLINLEIMQKDFWVVSCLNEPQYEVLAVLFCNITNNFLSYNSIYKKENIFL